MANVTLLGANYSDVPAVELPKTGGGVATFHEVVGSRTVTQNGTYDVSGLAEMVVNVPTGGANNFVRGTFTCDGYGSTGIQTIDVSYTGNGYPISMNIYPVEGAYNSESYIYSLVKRYGIIFYNWVKSDITTPPTYSGSGVANQASWVRRYKSSTSSATSYSHSTVNNSAVVFASGNNPDGGLCVVMSSNTQFKIKIVSNSAYGFVPTQQYVYEIVYSS